MEPGMHAASKMFTHTPGVVGSQALWTGLHWKTERKISATLLAKMMAARHQRSFVKLGTEPKTRWKRRRADHLKVEVPTQ